MPGSYLLRASSANTWGGVNSTDGLLIQKHFVQELPLSGIFLRAADVNASTYVNSTDAVISVRRFVGLITSFASGDWIFDSLTVVVSNSDITQNLSGLCYGDVNGSWTVPNFKTSPDVMLQNYGQLEVAPGESFSIPLVAATGFEAGAVSLVMRYPENLVEILGVDIAEGQENLQYNTAGGLLRIGWFHGAGYSCESGATLLSLRVRLRNAGTDPGQVTFSLEGQESQLADIYGITLPEVNLLMPELVGNTASTADFLLQNHPNPASHSTTFSFVAPEEGLVNISLYNPGGVLVHRIATDLKAARAMNTLAFDLSALAQGVYYYQFEFKGQHQQFIKTQKMVIAR
jgi:hypothetical protein